MKRDDFDKKFLQVFRKLIDSKDYCVQDGLVILDALYFLDICLANGISQGQIKRYLKKYGQSRLKELKRKELNCGSSFLDGFS